MQCTGRGLTLIEVLVVIAIIALLAGLLLPTLAAARESARAAACLANLRNMGLIIQTYADEHHGTGPAIGVPWEAPPNWALVVQQAAGLPGTDGDSLYRQRSALVCPSTEARLRRGMTRTYAMNATGHAGPTMGDQTSYDDADRPGHIRLGLVHRPSARVLLVDSAVAFIPDGAPPPTRTASVLDFRQHAHVADRLGRVHHATRTPEFQALRVDGSAGTHRDIPTHWTEPLP